MFLSCNIDIIISYSFKTARFPGEKRAERRGVLGAAILFVIATVIGLTIARGQLHIHIMRDFDLGGLRFCWSTVHVYFVILNKKCPRLKISLPLFFQTSKGHIKYTKI